MIQTDQAHVGMRIIRGFAMLEHGTLEVPTEPRLTVFYSPAMAAREQFDRENRENRGTTACPCCLRWRCRKTHARAWNTGRLRVKQELIHLIACNACDRPVAGRLEGLCGVCATRIETDARAHYNQAGRGLHIGHLDHAARSCR